jgi:GT2 family glycosyltransferase
MSLSIVVPTRGRPSHALACANVILGTQGFIELIIVDQSDDFLTQEALAAIDDGRLRYVRSDTRGVTNGRNVGIGLCRGSLIAFTDDDCRVSADWAGQIVALFAADPSVAVVCGCVRVPEELQRLGWAESFQPRRKEWQRRYPPIGEWGITANLALRRDVVREVGTFDPMLGAGAPLRSGGEPDLLIRVLRCGHKVVNAPEVVVDHLGVRKPGDESSQLIRSYGVGTAAAFLKHVRLGDLRAAAIISRFMLRTTIRVVARVLTWRRPTGAGFLLALLSGAFVSCRYPIDRGRRLYRQRRRPDGYRSAEPAGSARRTSNL